jgi:UDP-N-acetyl-D-glucosamine dehydrogenase
VVADRLLGMGANVRAVDPYVHESFDARVALVDLDAEEVTQADAVVLLTDHDAFDLELVQSKARFVLDTRARLHGPNVDRL